MIHRFCVRYVCCRHHLHRCCFGSSFNECFFLPHPYSHGIFHGLKRSKTFTKQLYCISPPFFYCTSMVGILMKENISLNIIINCSLWSKCAKNILIVIIVCVCFFLYNCYKSTPIAFNSFLNIRFEIECAPERDWNASTHSYFRRSRSVFNAITFAWVNFCMGMKNKCNRTEQRRDDMISISLTWH